MQSDLKDAIASGNDIKKKLDALSSSGFPFGWEYFPYGQKASPFGTGYSSLLRYAIWGLGIALTGVFAGLGAPFWYDVIRNLNDVARSNPAGKAKSAS